MEAVEGIRHERVRSPRGRLRTRLAPSYETHQQRAIGQVDSVLDVGCGANSPLGRFGVRYAYTMGVELFGPALERSRSLGIHDDYLAVDALELAERLQPRSFDAAVAFDLIEHLGKEDGFALLTAMERIARDRVVVFTPNGFLPQAPADGNPYQAHRSGWSAGDFQELGYEVRGVHGLRHLRGDRASLRWRPGKFWGAVSDLIQPLVHRRPALAFHLLCIKHVRSYE
jgi:SAM-dependent methyltransferase